jgi:hypothetical protein
MRKLTSMKKRMASLSVLVLAMAVLSGCQEQDEIRQYKAPRVEYPKGRLLGAIVPRSDFMWFFKLDGPPDAVAGQKDNFDAFIHSLKFTGNEKDPVTWTVPDGWVQHPGDQMRFATLSMRTNAKALDLTVTKLDAKANTVLDNVNRWRGQLDLPKVDEQGLAKVVNKIKVENEDVTIVDIVGSVSLVKAGGMRGQMARMPAHPPRENLDRALRPRIAAPPGWHEIEPEKQTIADVKQVAAFRVGEGDKVADVRVKVMTLQTSLLDNVIRWRKDPLKLPPINETELAAIARKIPCMGGQADYVDLKGSPTGLRMLGAFLAQGRVSWIFMMTGPDAVVGEQKDAFENFVRDFSR